MHSIRIPRGDACTFQFLDKANGAAAEPVASLVNGEPMPAGGNPAQADNLGDSIPF